MSIINKMLNDLHHRQQPHHMKNIPQNQLPLVENKSKLWLLLMMALVCFVIGVMSILAWQWWQQSNTSALSQAHSTSPLSIAKTDVITDEKPTTTVISHIATTKNHVEQNDLAKNGSQSDPNKVIVTAKTQVIHSALKKAQSDKALLDKPQLDQAQLNGVQAYEKKPATQSNTQQKVTSEKIAIANAKKDNNTIKLAKQAPISQSKLAITEVKLTPVQIAKSKVNKAQQLEQQGQLDDAIFLYTDALKYNSAMHQARSQLAALYYGQGRMAQAINTLEEGIALYPRHYQYALLLSRVQQSINDLPAALQTLSLIADTSSEARQKWVHQGDIAQRLKNYSVAESAYRHLLQQESSQGNWWLALGYNIDLQGRYKEAAQVYRTALTKHNLSDQSITYIENRLAQLGVRK